MSQNYLSLDPTLENFLILDPNLPYDYLLLEPEVESIQGDVYVQFSNTPSLNNLLNGLQPLLTISVDEFYFNYFDIDTCNGQGLDNWGALLNINRTINVPNFENVFGFDNGGPLVDDEYPCNFGMGNFYGGQIIPTALDDYTFRTLLKLRYAYITTNATIGAANIIMNTYVQSLNITYKANVIETGPMAMQFQFNFTITNEQETIFNLPRLLPVPSGVSYTLLGNVSL